MVLSPVAKQKRSEAGHALPSSAEVMHYGSSTSTPQHTLMVSTGIIFTVKKYEKYGGVTRQINSSRANEMTKQA